MTKLHSEQPFRFTVLVDGETRSFKGAACSHRAVLATAKATAGKHGGYVGAVTFPALLGVEPCPTCKGYREVSDPLTFSGRANCYACGGSGQALA